MISDLPGPIYRENAIAMSGATWTKSASGRTALRGRASQPKSVRDIVATEPIWDRSELPREEVTARIIAAGRRIDYAYALSAMTFAGGRISLDNGVHRWAVAVEMVGDATAQERECHGWSHIRGPRPRARS